MSESTRLRRFTLPDMGDLRVDESISSFLTGPANLRGRPVRGTVTAARRSPYIALETRMDWTAAMHRENARCLRYGRPAAIVVIAAEADGSGPEADGWLGRIAAPIAHAIQRGIRGTDLVTRTSTSTFQVLLPETTGAVATEIAHRVAADCDVWLHAMHAPVVLRAGAAGTTPDISLEAALDLALEAIGAR
jgi:hypothetical protein